jgi:diadenosine tetraphosphate (Ap4A) HIT family hydrolase
MKDIFSSSNEYKKIFNDGLIQLSSDESLGTFILAMANATFDEEIYRLTKESLQANFSQLKLKYIDCFTQGKKLNEVDEDLLVFLKMVCVGFEKLQTTVFRNESDWELQFNHVRGFKPNRITQQKIDGLVLPFSAAGFNFNKPFMAKERLWEGEHRNVKLSLYYNKYPFAHYHTLLVPEREKQYPQFLELSQHNMMWDFLESVGRNIKGIGVGYNSRGAFSSVNHLHFQLFIRDKALPVTASKWQHNGGNEKYPSACNVFNSYKESEQFIEHLHETNTAYNLLYFPGRVYCFPRKVQGSYHHAQWTPGFSWYELAGGLLTANNDSYRTLTETDIRHEFNLLDLEPR